MKSLTFPGFCLLLQCSLYCPARAAEAPEKSISVVHRLVGIDLMQIPVHKSVSSSATSLKKHKTELNRLAQETWQAIELLATSLSDEEKQDLDTLAITSQWIKQLFEQFSIFPQDTRRAQSFADLRQNSISSSSHSHNPKPQILNELVETLKTTDLPSLRTKHFEIFDEHAQTISSSLVQR